jgi:hypothetical protein
MIQDSIIARNGSADNIDLAKYKAAAGEGLWT